MDTQEIKREANDLYKTVQPLLERGQEFEQFLLTDLAKIVLICGRSNNDISPNELLGFLVVHALIKQDRETLKVVLNEWDTSRDVRLKYQKQTVKLLVELKNNFGPEDHLILPSVLNQLDEQQGTRLLETTMNAIYRFAQVIVKADGDISMEEMAALSVVWRSLHTYEDPTPYLQQASQSPTAAPATPTQESLEQVLDELNQLVGMNNIKEEVKTLTNFLKVQKVRTERGLANASVSLHSVFSGPPGTGKTTVARLMGRIFRSLGFLEKGQLVETDRAGLVADYIGGTAKKVDEKVNEALDGLLFIDEAYALIPEDSSRDFGQEAVDVLLKRMEDYRKRLVVIAAGYTNEMHRFVESNPGLKSRFNRYFYFQDHTPDELVAIFNKMCKDNHFSPTEATNEKLKTLLTELYNTRDRTFGNARLVRNLFEKAIERQANRLAVINTLTDEILTTILPEDIPNASEVLPQPPMTQSSPGQAIPNADSAQMSSSDWLAQLTTLLNQSLQPLGTIARTNLKSNRLQILFEADPVPNPAEMASLTLSQLKRLPLRAFTQLQLYGRRSGEEIPDWSQEFDLDGEGSEGKGEAGGG